MAKKSSKGLGLATEMPAMPKIDKRYQAEDDVRTLERADEIKNDKPRFSMARSVAKEKMKTLTRIARK